MTAVQIDNANVIDGLGNPPVPHMTVLVEGNRITAVTPTAEQPAFTSSDGGGVTRIDAAGKTVMPGLIDAHCHMTFGESYSQEEQELYTSVESRTLRAAWNAKKVLAAGVTGIAQPGGSYFIGVAVRDAVQAGRVVGPRMSSAGRFITTSNGLTDFYPDSVGLVEGRLGVRCNTIDEMISEVRHQIKNGVDFVKLADSAFGEYQSFRDEELQVIADLAHQLNSRVTIHARGDAEVNAAARAGFDWIMHGNVMTAGTVELLAERGIPLVPTILLLHNWAEHGNLVGAPEPISVACGQMLEQTAKSLQMAREAGVTFVVGTDTGFAITPYGEWHAKELELLMDYTGMTALEAIQAGTSNAGFVLRREGDVGAIAPGMLADLLVVDGDPSRDIRILQDRSRLTTIMLDGKVVELPDEIESWPHERAMTYSIGYLTRDLVDAAGDPAG